MDFPDSILLTSIGSSNSQSILKILKDRFPKIKVFTSDTNAAVDLPRISGIEGFRRLPAGIDKDYQRSILGYCKEKEIKLIVPVHDDEVLAVSSFKSELKSIGTEAILADEECLKVIRDKYLFYKVANEEDLPIIQTSLSPLSDFPMFVKPRIGNGSKNCYEVNDEEELRVFSKRIDEAIFQPKISASKFVVDFTANSESRITSLLTRKEIKTVAGNGTIIQIVKNSDLERITQKLVMKTSFIGLGNIEFFLTEDKIHLIELNPRASSGINFTYLAGVDIFTHLINIELDQKMETKDLSPEYGKTFHRVFREVEGGI